MSYAGHTGTVVYLTTDGFHRVSWDDPLPDDAYFNLGRVFRPDTLKDIGVDEGPKCQQPNGCGGITFLSKEENHRPSLCRVCKLVLCDTCAAWAEGIPREAVMPKRLSGTPWLTSFVRGALCSDHFNEDWVDAPKPPQKKTVYHLTFNGGTPEQLLQFLKKLAILADVEVDGTVEIKKILESPLTGSERNATISDSDSNSDKGD